MSAPPISEPPPAPTPKPAPPAEEPSGDGHAAAKTTPRWQKYLTPILVVLLAIAIVVTITRNWNSWEGGKVDQVTDDAYVRGDLTPLSTKVAGIVLNVRVSDYQDVHKGELLVELEDNDFKAQVAQASAAVEAAKAAIENNVRQRELQDARIQKALAGIDQAKAQIAAAQAGKDAVQAELWRARLERKRQEGLLQTHSTTQQREEAAVADEERLAGQYASRDADLVQARAMLHSSEQSAEAERRMKVVLESEEVQLVADLHAKEAGCPTQPSFGWVGYELARSCSPYRHHIVLSHTFARSANVWGTRPGAPGSPFVGLTWGHSTGQPQGSRLGSSTWSAAVSPIHAFHHLLLLSPPGTRSQ